MYQKVTPPIAASLATLYQDGLSATKISRIVGLSVPTVTKALRAQGHSTATKADKGRNRLYSLAHNSFAVLDEASEYWIGFLMADGCVYRNRTGRYMSCTLKSDDASHVVKLSTFLRSSYPIVTRTQKTTGGTASSVTGIAVRSEQLCQDLERWGVTERKSLSAQAAAGLTPSRHFWRGMIDGDGWIGMSEARPRVLLTGSQIICEQFATYVNELLGSSYSAKPCTGNQAWRTSITSSRRTKQLLDHLYSNCNVALDRKKERALSITGT
jgi:hypothetical protein